LATGCAHAPDPVQEPAPRQAASAPAPAPTPQKAADPKELSAQADKSYYALDFPACATLFRAAAEASTDDDSRSNFFYSAACCAALAGDSAQALELVKRSVQSGYYDAAYLQSDPELAPLHSLAGWAEVVASAKANLAKLPQPPRPVPVLAAVDVYGSRRADAEAVRKLLGFELKKPFVASFVVFRQKEEALRKQNTLAFAKLSFISYFAGPEAGRAYITADLVDAEDAQRLKFLPEPTSSVADPEGLIAQWQAYEQLAWKLLNQGALDTSKPSTCRVAHCTMGFSHPDLAPFEPIFVEKVPKAQEALTQVLRQDADNKKRAAAAYLLAYASTPKQAVERLVPSTRDPNALVRNNVLRVLMAIQKSADRPMVDFAVAADALSMPETTDRNKAGALLKALLEDMKPEALKAQRASYLRQIGPQLVAMAALQQPNNRDHALEVLKLLSGEKYETAEQWKAWLEARPERSPQPHPPPQRQGKTAPPSRT
jgi:hypothetical protein